MYEGSAAARTLTDDGKKTFYLQTCTAAAEIARAQRNASSSPTKSFVSKFREVERAEDAFCATRAITLPFFRNPSSVTMVTRLICMHFSLDIVFQ